MKLYSQEQGMVLVLYEGASIDAKYLSVEYGVKEGLNID